MEEYIFKTYFKMTYEEYRKMWRMSLRKHWLMYAVLFSIPFLLSLEDMIRSGMFASLLISYVVIIIGIFFLLTPIRAIMYKRNRRLNEFEQTTYFYEDRLEADTNIAHIKIKYMDLHSIFETKTNFYLYTSGRSLLIVDKTDISPENVAFIANVAKTLKDSKKKAR